MQITKIIEILKNRKEGSGKQLEKIKKIHLEAFSPGWCYKPGLKVLRPDRRP